jgi:hypothetical protein
MQRIPENPGQKVIYQEDRTVVYRNENIVADRSRKKMAANRPPPPPPGRKRRPYGSRRQDWEEEYNRKQQQHWMDSYGEHRSSFKYSKQSSDIFLRFCKVLYIRVQ